MKNNNENKIEEVKEEIDSYSDDSLFNISSFGMDMSFRELVSMYNEDELEKPELQRKYVWTKNEASRFIDSILLGLPVPSIFLAKTKDEKRLIVDGYQRIMTVVDYVEGIFSGDGKIFKLSNSDNINKKWKGKTFKELSVDEQRKIRNSGIHAIVFEQKQPQNDTGMYQIFERINTSGRILKPQEIRNCVYHGGFNAFLFKLNKNEIWRKILGTTTEDSRMADVELILRCFAFIDFGKEREQFSKQINLSKYLNEYMNKFKNASSEDLLYFEENFIKIITYLNLNLKEFCFKAAKKTNDNYKWAKKINPVILDAICTATSFAIRKNISLPNSETLLSRYMFLVTENKEFIEAYTNRTTNVENIKKRINNATSQLYGIDYEW